MRILLIEDEEPTIQQLQGYLQRECNAVVQIARSRDSALELLQSNSDYDLIVCDLKIPTQDGALDVDEKHGFVVHDTARTMHPGTFSRFLSGFVELDNVGSRIATGPAVDVFGTGEQWALINAVEKKKLDNFLRWCIELNERLTVADSIMIEPAENPMGIFEERTLRIYTMKLNGTRVNVNRLGGLSASSVYQADIMSDSGGSVGVVVSKIGLLPRVQEELEKYRRYIAPRLPIGMFAPLAGEVLHGCGRYGAAFYSLASVGYRNLFSLCETDIAVARESLEHLRSAYDHWSGQSTVHSVSVRDLRAVHLPDDALTPWLDVLDETCVRNAENTSLSVSYHLQHGDLHGLNVLVDNQRQALLIDYSDLGQHPVSLDPVTLEMSLIFHPERPDLGGWPTVEQASQWFDLHEYAGGSAAFDVVDACRRWSLSVTSTRQLAAIVYAHALRQLRYHGTDKPVAVAIARAAMAVLTEA